MEQLKWAGGAANRSLFLQPNPTRAAAPNRFTPTFIPPHANHPTWDVGEQHSVALGSGRPVQQVVHAQAAAGRGKGGKRTSGLVSVLPTLRDLWVAALAASSVFARWCCPAHRTAQAGH